MRYSQLDYIVRYNNKSHKLKTLTNITKYCTPLQNAEIYENETLVIKIENNIAIAVIDKMNMIVENINYVKSKEV